MTGILGSGQVDLQVMALIGNEVPTNEQNGTVYGFDGVTSVWSSTQTITIPVSSSSPTPMPTPIAIESFALTLAISIIAVIIAFVIALLLYRRRRKTISKNKPNV